jgi:hypothetical protein
MLVRRIADIDGQVQARCRIAPLSHSLMPPPSPLFPARARIPTRRIGRVALQGDAAVLMSPLQAVVFPRPSAVYCWRCRISDTDPRAELAAANALVGPRQNRHTGQERRERRVKGEAGHCE